MVSLKWLSAHTDTIRIGGNETVCANCAHFVRHYIADDRELRYIPISLGHCTEPNIKNRNAGDSCPRFRLREEG